MIGSDMEPVTLKFESASCRIKEKDGYIWLTNVYARKRGLGHGTRLMELVTEYADAHSMDLCLVVQAYNSVANKGILTNGQLILFYKKFGFDLYDTGDRTIEMFRPSQK